MIVGQGKAILQLYPASEVGLCNGRAIILDFQHCGREELSLAWDLLPEQIMSSDSIIDLCTGYHSLCISDEWGREAIIDFELDYDEEVQIIDLTWYCLDSMTYMGDIELINSVVHVDTRDTMAKVEVEILRNKKFFTRLISPTTGEFSTLLPVGYLYDIYYKKKGYYSKYIVLDARDASVIDVGAGYSTAPSVSMIPIRDGLDLSILSQPIGLMAYVQKLRTFEYDFEYTARFKARLNELLGSSE